MNMLFIASGYRRVYPYFEQSLCTAFQKVGVNVIGNKPYTIRTVAELKKLCSTHRVDWLFMFLGDQLPEDCRQALRSRCLPPLSVWFTEDPYHLERAYEILPFVKRGWTVEESVVKGYQEKGGNVTFLPLGYDPKTFYAREIGKVNDICFVGYPYPERVALIKALGKALPVQIEVVGPWRAEQLPKKVIHQSRWLDPSKVARCYHQARVVLNTFRPYQQQKDGVEANSVNNRSFEIAACGAFQLSEYRPGVKHFFPKNSIETFTNIENCIKLMSVYLDDEKRRDQKMQRALEVVRRAHTFSHRAADIVSQLRKVK